MASTEETKGSGGAIPPRPARQFQPTGTFRSLRHRNFQLYFGGQLISIAGTWMQIVAQGWLVYQISHSELTLGIVGFASAIPALIVAPFGGAVVDRLPKRSILIASQVGAMVLAFVLAALAFSGLTQVWHVVVLAAALGFMNAFDGPARQAFVVEMVGREDLTNAIALNSMMFNGARVIGPALGGLLLATVGSGWCFLINGLSYIAVIVGLAAMKLPPHTVARATAAPMREMARGLRYVLAHVEQFALLLLALIYAVFGLSYNTVLPAFSDVVLRAGPQGYGLLNAATGVGAMAGALIIARTGGGGRRGFWMTVSSLSFPIVLLAFAVVTNLYISLALALILGLVFMVQFTLINTLLQLHVADDMRGRVLSLYVLTWFGFAPFGNLAMGNLAEHWGLSLTIALAAGVSMALALIVFAIVPRLRRLP